MYVILHLQIVGPSRSSTIYTSKSIDQKKYADDCHNFLSIPTFLTMGWFLHYHFSFYFLLVLLFSSNTRTVSRGVSFSGQGFILQNMSNFNMENSFEVEITFSTFKKNGSLMKIVYEKV